jgi:MinD superfamily P-loop ATPase
MKKTISIISSKGGVGKTMLTVSLIDFLAKNKRKVLAVDADVNAPNLSKWFDNIEKWDLKKEINIFPLPKKYENCKDLKLYCNGIEIPIELENRGSALLKQNYKPSFSDYTIDFISGDITKGKTGSGKVVEGTLKLAKEINSEFTIVDTAPGTGYPVITAINNSDYIIVITEPTELGLKDLNKLLEIIPENKEYGVVINKTYSKNNILKKIIEKIDNKYLGFIKYDENILSALELYIPPMYKSNNKDLDEVLNNIYSKIK